MPEQPRFSSQSARWVAVLGRDRQADGVFVYAVRTTGVYCRPSCGSRRPRSENVECFDSWQLAERKGYRACRKCHPRAANAGRIPEAVALGCAIIERSASPPTLAVLARAVGLSRFHFHRLFKRTIGVTPRAYARRVGQSR